MWCGRTEHTLKLMTRERLEVPPLAIAQAGRGEPRLYGPHTEAWIAGGKSEPAEVKAPEEPQAATKAARIQAAISQYRSAVARCHLERGHATPGPRRTGMRWTRHVVEPVNTDA